MDAKIDFIPSGTVTSPGGFRSGATCAGIKREEREKLDLGILFSEMPCAVGAGFTTNWKKAAPVLACQHRGNPIV